MTYKALKEMYREYAIRHLGGSLEGASQEDIERVNEYEIIMTLLDSIYPYSKETKLETVEIGDKRQSLLDFLFENGRYKEVDRILKETLPEENTPDDIKNAFPEIERKIRELEATKAPKEPKEPKANDDFDEH